jgi:hypothetical protein
MPEQTRTSHPPNPGTLPAPRQPDKHVSLTVHMANQQGFLYII